MSAVLTRPGVSGRPSRRGVEAKTANQAATGGSSKAAGARVIRIQGSILVVHLEFAVPSLRAAFRNRIDDAAEGAAELRLETARLNLDFLDEIRLKVLSYTSNINVRGIDAVDQVDIFPVAGAINLEAAGAVAPGAL